MITKKDVEAARAKVRYARNQYLQTLVQHIVSCEHERWFEVPYHQTTFFGTNPPTRVCEDCGLWVEGWNMSFNPIGTGIYSDYKKGTYNMAIKARTTPLISAEDYFDKVRKGKLSKKQFFERELNVLI